VLSGGHDGGAGTISEIATGEWDATPADESITAAPPPGLARSGAFLVRVEGKW
jgi:hypothetical protein